MDGLFHPLIADWFRGKFGTPTPAQEQGWPAISAGRHALVAAPTGSGKTLAAFLVFLDQLVRAGLEGVLPEGTSVVYVSPLKALSNDVQKNLLAPLAEIRELALSCGLAFPEIRVGVRTGDTLAGERRKQAKTPPHILITTPESLYVLLSSASGRAALGSARTLIVDEIHAVAANKRGSHLALSMERLDAVAGRPVVRVGLSATQRPIEEVARFLVGSTCIDASGRPDCLIVDAGHRRKLDLSLWTPEQEWGPIATHEMWGEALDDLAARAAKLRSTLVFVGSRRMAERISFQLSQRLGIDQVVTHHGSLSRQIRLDAEQRLKNADVKVCVATASLELGIDIGQIDLVAQIGSARALATFLQRVGRSGHGVGAVPRAIVYPLTRDELLECTAMLAGVKQGELDRLTIPAWPLDVLAQQIVAACSVEEWDEEALWETVRRAYPYRELPRSKFEQVLDMLSEGVSGRTGRSTAYLHRDQVNHRLRGRRAAKLVALTNGGAIPENADYDVIMHSAGTKVGTINEDFAIESMAGDIFQLGNTSWQVMRVESGRVRVEDAHGAPPTLPFWLGEAPSRTAELSGAVSRLREELADRLGDHALAVAHAMEVGGLEAPAAEQLVAYLEEGKRVLGVIPTAKRIVAERFFDESGGMQLIIHAPLGGRINRAWGHALRKKFCRSFDFELQAAATDDGINLSLGPQHSFPLAEIFDYVKSIRAEEVLTQAVLQSPLFGVRWRHAVTRSLFVLRFSRGKKVPSPLQRMRSDDLLSSVFPAQAGCQDNRGAGEDVEPPDHPLVFEALRDCLREALDVDGLVAVLAAMERGEIELLARDTPQPSVFAHQLLNAAPYAFLDDAPLEERRARAVSLRRALPDDTSDLGQLDTAAILAAAEDAWPTIRDPDELHDALLTLGVMPVEPIGARAVDPAWVAALQEQKRLVQAIVGDRRLWVAVERAAMVMTAYPNVRFEPASARFWEPGQVGGVPEDQVNVVRGEVVEQAGAVRAKVPEREDALLAIVRGWAECSGPLTVGDVELRTALPRSSVEVAFALLEGNGLVLRGKFTPDRNEPEICDRRILARIHRATIRRLRREIEPVTPAMYLDFLFEWQHATPQTQTRGAEGLLLVLDQLAGFEAPAAAWERAILPARISDYEPAMLDRLALGGEVTWGRFSGRPGDSGTADGDEGVAGGHRGAGHSSGSLIYSRAAGGPGARAAVRPKSPITGLTRGTVPGPVASGTSSGTVPGGAAGSGLDRSGQQARRGGLTRAVPISFGFRNDLWWLLGLEPGAENRLSSVARAILDALDRRGALFAVDLAGSLGVLNGHIEEALGQLVAAGLVTSDGFAALRGLTSGTPEHEARQSRWLKHRRFRAPAGGRWSRLFAGNPPGLDFGAALTIPPGGNPSGRKSEAARATEIVEERAAQLLRRYGVLCREALAREPLAPPWQALVSVLRRAEARGEIRGGRFVEGFIGEQFALPEAVDALRAVRRRGQTVPRTVISAVDPLNLSGILTSGLRIPAIGGHFAAYEQGAYEDSAAPIRPSIRALLHRTPLVSPL